MTMYKELVNDDCTVIYHGNLHYLTNRVSAGALDWAYETFPQDPKVKQNRVSYILGNLMFAYKEDYMQFRLTWL